MAQTTEQKKEEFRKYLEQAGVIDQLTKTLVGLYEDPDKGSNAIEKIKKELGAPSDADVEVLKSENEDLKQGIEVLQRELADCQSKIEDARAKNQ